MVRGTISPTQVMSAHPLPGSACLHAREGDLVGPVNPQPAQKVGVGLVPLGGLAGIGLLVDRQ